MVVYSLSINKMDQIQVLKQTVITCVCCHGNQVAMTTYYNSPDLLYHMAIFRVLLKSCVKGVDL